MDKLAHSLLDKLFADAEKNAAGRRARPAVLTTSNLAEYHALRSLQAKDAFESTMQAASAARAVSLTWGNRAHNEEFIQRVEVLDVRALAMFLGHTLNDDRMSAATTLFAPLTERFPVLDDVLQKWSQLRKVRTFSAEDAQDWVDAVLVIDFARNALEQGAISTPVNEASGKLFNDSKRIKKLVAPIDVLLTGSVDGEAREASEVLEEIGLFREEHPVRLAGNVVIERERLTACLDVPYTGLPAATVRRVVTKPHKVITIENQTTFHSEARRLCGEEILFIYTAGMPNPPWLAMYARLLKSLPHDVPVYHWGDIDEGGFRIAAVLARTARGAGHALQPWLMHPDNVPKEKRRPAGSGTVERMKRFAIAAGWSVLGDAIAEAKFTIEQESL
ncbi:MAG TPA: Wadjet anti-phage system protein JetD domain-containing protein [Halothiobacillus sp.]|nr:Wadjet anti-phage system protein JetD domain-containing protein [Halothiobacillus sp.]